MTQTRPPVPPQDAAVGDIAAILARGYLRLLVGRQKALDEQPENEALCVSPVRTDATPDTTEDPGANLECRGEHTDMRLSLGTSVTPTETNR